MADEKTYSKADLDAAIAEAKEAQDAKNRELLAEVKALKADLRKTQEIKPEDFAALEGELEATRAKLAEATKQAKDATKLAEDAKKQLEGESAFTRKLLVENGLRAELAAAGVTNPVHQKAAIAMHAAMVEIGIDGENRVAKVGDKALADFVKEWAASDEGKHFVAAPINQGGGAPGGKGGASGKTMSNADFLAMPAKDRAAFMTGGGQIVDAAA